MAISRETAITYLQGLASSGQFVPSKPLAEYKTPTLQRKASTFQRQQAAGQAPSNKAARGHRATPEHGNPELRGIPRDTQVGRDRIRTSASEAGAERSVNIAAASDRRVVIKVHTPDGGWQTVGGNPKHSRGINAEYLAGKIAETGGISEALQEITGGGSGGGEGSDDIDDWEAIDGWQIDIIDWY
jgi:hypothetical protein